MTWTPGCTCVAAIYFFFFSQLDSIYGVGMRWHRGLIPALERGTSDRVCESMVCVEYVDEAFPAASSGDESSLKALMPPMSDPGARARCRYWYVERLSNEL